MSSTATDTDPDTGLTTTATTGPIALDVAVAAVADAPDLVGLGGGVDGWKTPPLASNITTVDVDVDGSEAITSVTIAGIPDGAVVAAGTDSGLTVTLSADGTTATVTGSGPGGEFTTADLASLAGGGVEITPTEDTGVDFTLQMSSTATDTDPDTGDKTTATTGPAALDVAVAAVADAPDLSVAAASTVEDTTVGLAITTVDVDVDGSEAITSVTIAAIPDGAVVAAGTDSGLTVTLSADGTTATVTGSGPGGEFTTADLASLAAGGVQITPTEDTGVDFTLQVSSTATDTDPDTGDKTTATTGPAALDVAVAAVADAPDLSVAAASTLEDTTVGLAITTVDVDVDGSEAITSVTIAAIPDGAVVAAGTDSGLTVTLSADGTTATVTGSGPGGEFTQADLDSLAAGGVEITPTEDTGVDFTLQVSSTATDTDPDTGDKTTATTGPAALDVAVAAVADAPDLSVAAASTAEDTTVGLAITTVDVDVDGSEAITSVTIAAIPDGAVVAAGTDSGLTVTLSADGTTATVTGSGPGGEFTTADLASLAGGGVEITPTEDTGVDFTLQVSSTATDTDPDTGDKTTATTGPAALAVTVAAVADAPDLSVSAAGTLEDTTVGLNIATVDVDVDGSEAITSVTIAGIPAGAVVAAGTDSGLTVTLSADGTTATVTGSGPGGEFTTADLASLNSGGVEVTPTADTGVDFTLQVSSTATDTDPDTGLTTTATTGPIALDVAVAAVADAPDLSVSAAGTLEDTTVGLNIATVDVDVDGSEAITSVTIAGIPAGAVVAAGTDSGLTVTLSADGTTATVTGSGPGGEFTTADLASLNSGGVEVTPTKDSNVDFTLQISSTATDTDPNTGLTTTAETGPVALAVGVTGVADAPTAVVRDDAGAEDNWIQLHLDSALKDTDGSESLSITITNVPDGARLNPGTDNGDGTWTVTPSELPLVCILPPDDFSGEMTMTLNVTSTENDGDTATTSEGFTVAVAAVADTPDLSVSAASTAEDTTVGLAITTVNVDVDGSEAVTSVTIAGIPAGAVVAAGTDSGLTVTLSADGTTATVTGSGPGGAFTAADLETLAAGGIEVTPPAESGADFTLQVSSTVTDTNPVTGATSTVTSGAVGLAVTVAAIADAPDVVVSDASGAGNEAIPLDVDPSVAGADSSEDVTSITIAGVPDGAVLATGTDGTVLTGGVPQSDGTVTYTLTPDQLDGLTVTPPDGSGDDFTLQVSATTTETDPDSGVQTTATSDPVPLEVVVTATTDPDDDVLVGTSGDDVLVGGAGDDDISGLGGDDILYGDNAELPAMYVLSGDDSSEPGSILQISSDGSVEVAVSEAEITALTGEGSADMGNQGIAVDGGGNLFFTDDKSDSILMKPAGGGPLQVVASEADIAAATGLGGSSDANAEPQSLAIGSDGKLYVSDEASDSILSVDPATGAVTVVVSKAQMDALEGVSGVDLEGGIVAGLDGKLYVASDTSTDVIFEIDTSAQPATVSVLANVPEFQDLDVFMALAPNGDLIVADDYGSQTIFRVETSGDDKGSVSEFISHEQLHDTIGPSIDLEGGIGFDAAGNFYIAEENTDSVFTWTGYNEETGEIDGTSGTLFVSQSELEAGLGDNVDLEGGIAFGQGFDPNAVVAGDDVLDGGAGDDVLIGGAGDDDLTGGDGDDILIGDGAAAPAMYLLDEGHDGIVRISAAGTPELVVSQDEIIALTGKSDADMDDRGIAVDAEGNIFFTEKDSDAIFMKPADGGDLQIVATRDDLAGATGGSSSNADPKSLTIGSDGKLYVSDDSSDSILSVDPFTGDVTVLISKDDLKDIDGISSVDLDGGIVATEDGRLYAASDGDPDAIFEIDIATGTATVLASGTPFKDLDVFMTLAPNGDLIVADDSGSQTIFRVDTSGDGKGTVSEFITHDQLHDVIGHSIDLEGGISFDAAGNFYVAEENTDNVYKFSGYDEETGTIDPESGEVFVSGFALNAATGDRADLEGGLTSSDWVGIESEEDGDDVLAGGEGDDVLFGGGGMDTLSGGDDDDQLFGGSGDDILDGGSGDDILKGGAGDDTLSGGEGDDVLLGGSGDDVISGGAGDDDLWGGDGSDTFVFHDGDGDDTVQDFDIGDTLMFEGLEFNLDDMIVTQDGDDAIVTFGADSNVSVKLKNTDAAKLKERDRDDNETTGGDGYTISQTDDSVTITYDGGGG